ncbi:MAG: hypothetical protein KF890_06605 [Nitrospira sp.]|nr:hypothetical protein [Nitrospira sp.]
MIASRILRAWSARWGLFGLATIVSLSWLNTERGMALETMPAQEPRIEIAIRNSTYMSTKTMPIRAGMPMVLVVRNEDPIPHGFSSPMFVGLPVTVEAGGIEVFGRGIDGLHVAPGETAVIRLTPGQQGKMTFRCDLHPNLEGELYLLDVPVG